MADSLQSFQWSGINKQGARVKGILKSVDVKSAETELRSMGIEIITITVSRNFNINIFEPSLKSKDLVLFTRYLSTMLAAGMPLIQALEVIGRDQESGLMKSIVNNLRNTISTGTSFSDALNQYPRYFNPLYRALASAGEKSGTLDKVLKRLGAYLEKMRSLKNKIRNALIYPITIVSVAVAVSLILLLFVVPQFQTMFANAHAQLPYFTQIVIHFSDFLRGYWWIVLLFLGIGIYIFRRTLKTNEIFADWVSDFILKIPIIGTVIQKTIIARFTSTLAITLDAGMPIVESMRSMINIVGNRVYSKAIRNICDDITSGHPLSTSMAATKLFPNMVIQMISVGEASGALADMLNNITNYYEEEVNSIADNMSTLLEPVIIVILGIIIGVFVVAMYLPIFKLGSTI